MQLNHILALLFGVLAFVVGSDANDGAISTSKSTERPPHDWLPPHTTLRTSTKPANPPHHPSSHAPFDPHHINPAGMPFRAPHSPSNETFVVIGEPLEARAQQFKCNSGDKLMSYKSGRCDGRDFYACCPRGWQDAFGEDCVGLPACKYDPKNGKPQREWPGKSPNGAVNCADGYASTPSWYGGCMKEPLPASFNNGKCKGPAGNKCL